MDRSCARDESVRAEPSDTPAPFELFLSSSMALNDTSTFGAWWRRFMLGSRSVPPAMSMACGPSPARIFAASATERGARWSTHGSRSMALVFLAVAVLPWRQHEGGLWVRDR